jgi:hypothetical protein
LQVLPFLISTIDEAVAAATARARTRRADRMIELMREFQTLNNEWTFIICSIRAGSCDNERYAIIVLLVFYLILFKDTPAMMTALFD